MAWRDFVWRDKLELPVPEGLDLATSDVAILRIAPQAAFDPGLAVGIFDAGDPRKRPDLSRKSLARFHARPMRCRKELFDLPPSDDGTGLASIWMSRIRDISILGAGLLVLAVALARQKALTRSARRFKLFRLAYLAFTLVFIGWIAQAQVSIVWLFGLVKAIKGEGSFAFFLWDPPTLMVAVFGLVALFIWGRGTFCGWLCPFGALQEFAGEIARAVASAPDWSAAAL